MLGPCVSQESAYGNPDGSQSFTVRSLRKLAKSQRKCSALLFFGSQNQKEQDCTQHFGW